MDSAQIIVTILCSSGFTLVLSKSIDVFRDARAGHLQKRRAEVDKAIGERDHARKERDLAIADLVVARSDIRWWERWARILEEALAITRRRYIDAPGTDPDDLDPYPSRPDVDKP